MHRVTAISFANLSKKQDGFVPGSSGRQSPSKISPKYTEEFAGI